MNVKIPVYVTISFLRLIREGSRENYFEKLIARLDQILREFLYQAGLLIDMYFQILRDQNLYNHEISYYFFMSTFELNVTTVNTMKTTKKTSRKLRKSVTSEKSR